MAVWGHLAGGYNRKSYPFEFTVSMFFFIEVLHLASLGRQYKPPVRDCCERSSYIAFTRPCTGHCFDVQFLLSFLTHVMMLRVTTGIGRQNSGCTCKDCMIKVHNGHPMHDDLFCRPSDVRYCKI